MKIIALSKASDFAHLSQEGKKQYLTFGTLIYYKNTQQPELRLGFAVSKRLGNAVFRNKIKRRFRAALSSLIKKYPIGCDILFIGRKNAATIESKVMLGEIEKFLCKLSK